MDKVKNAEKLLLEAGMHPDLTDMQEICRDFLSEMDAGLRGTESSLKMIPTYLPPPDRPRMGRVIALDAGGTNLRRALVSFEPGRVNISDYTAMPMPGSGGEVSAGDFIETVAELAAPLAGISDKIGFCFSYPAQITPERDGISGSMCKEVKIRGIEGLPVGSALRDRLHAKGLGKANITVLNDTAASLLGGASGDGGNADFSSWIGLILGTGFNCSYVEHGELIKKLPTCGDMIINTEAGNFRRLKRGEADILFDAKTDNPGEQWLEKMVSGAYLGGLITETVLLLASRGTFSDGFKPLPDGALLSLREAGDFLKDPQSEHKISLMCGGDTDKQIMLAVIRLCLLRAAKLICAVIGALCENAGLGAQEAAMISAEGTVFQKSGIIRSMLLDNADSFIGYVLRRKVKFVSTEFCVLKGAAMAAQVPARV